MANMQSVRCGAVVVCVHNADPPSSQSWAEFMTLIRASQPRLIRVLVFTDGGGPNAVQRAEFVGHAGREGAVAVVTTSAIARGVITALSWLRSQIGGFAPGRAVDALAFVGRPAGELSGFLAEAHRLAARIDGGPPLALRGALDASVSHASADRR